MPVPAYHAHVYFNESTVTPAAALRETISETFDYTVGRFHEKCVGPHPRWSFQVIFKSDALTSFVPWLMENRGELTVFIHGLSGDDIYDHTQLTMWLGTSCDLVLDALT